MFTIVMFICISTDGIVIRTNRIVFISYGIKALYTFALKVYV
jgi:hypothetical protein